jgi:hypothetical protein
MTLKKLATLVGVVLVLVGVLGFVPGITTDDNLLLGIFEVNALHNVVHLLTGVAALVAAKSDAYARTFFLAFGVVYTVVALVGWVQGDTVLGIIPVNAADNVLHTLLAVSFLGAAFGLKARDGSDAARPSAAV